MTKTTKPIEAAAPGSVPIHVLHIEDLNCDALLIEHFLRNTYPGPVKLHRVKSLADGRAALGETAFDIILLDLGLPDATTMENDIAALHRVSPVPLIILSGSDNAEIVGRTFASGGEDALVKSLENFQTLGSVIVRTLERASAARLHQGQLQEMHALYRQYFDSCSDAVVMTTGTGELLSRNAHAERLWSATNIESYARNFRLRLDEPLRFPMILQFSDPHRFEIHDAIITPVAHNGAKILISTIRDTRQSNPASAAPDVVQLHPHTEMDADQRQTG
ncbi:response regulator [Maricaulis sp.]|uniref:response regulator n=1 Tax=Maricaulis sp. TaxID=1486257 RepID=UPI003A9509EA